MATSPLSGKQADATDGHDSFAPPEPSCGWDTAGLPSASPASSLLPKMVTSLLPPCSPASASAGEQLSTRQQGKHLPNMGKHTPQVSTEVGGRGSASRGASGERACERPAVHAAAPYHAAPPLANAPELSRQQVLWAVEATQHLRAALPVVAALMHRRALSPAHIRQVLVCPY